MNINWQELFKKLLPHILIFIIFVVATFIFLAPMLQGKRLPQNDIVQWQGSYQETKEFLEETGERTLWTNSMFGGMPTYQIAPWSPNSILGTRYFFNLLIGWSFPVPANAIFLYCIGFYLLLLALRINPWIAMFGALAYAFSSFNIIILEAGHMLQAYALGTGPMVLAAALYTVRWRKYLLGGAFFAVALAMHIATNHPQISYYTGLVLFIYLVFEFANLLRQKDFQPVIRSIGMFAIGLILAVAANITFQLTTLEYTKTTIRGPSELTQKEEVASTGLDKDYAFQWSYGIGETFSLLIPDFRGGPSGAIGSDNPDALEDIDPQLRQVVAQMDQYWGSQPFTSGPVYFGAILMFLFILGLLMINGPLKWWALTVFIFSAMLSWGHNFSTFNDFIFHYLPLYNKFRSVSFTLVMGSMVVPMLAMFTLQRIYDGVVWNDETKRKFYIALGCTAGLALIIYLMPSLAGDFLKPESAAYGNVSPDRAQLQNAQLQPAQIDMIIEGLKEARISILQSDAGRSLLFILLAAALVFFYFMKKVPQRWLIIGVGVLAVLDLAAVDKRYLGSDAFVRSRGGDANNIPMTAADQAILKDPDPHYRVINIAKNTFNDATTSYYHKSIGGYHGAKLRRFQEMRERYLDQLVSQLNQNLQNNIPPQELLRYLQDARMLSILNMMNTKYIIAGDNPQNVIMNPYNLNEAWFVSDINMVPNADAEIAALDSFMPEQTAIIDARYKEYMQGFTPSQAEGTIRMTEYKPNYLMYESSSSAEHFAVFSEVYYNSGLGWEAYIDGKPAEHIRVNFLLRGMRIPAGNHKIEFKFDPQSFKTGETISLIASILLLLLFFGAVFYEIRKNDKREEPKAV